MFTKHKALNHWVISPTHRFNAACLVIMKFSSFPINTQRPGVLIPSVLRRFGMAADGRLLGADDVRAYRRTSIPAIFS